MALPITDIRVINQLWVHANSKVDSVIQDTWTQGTNLLAFMNNEKYAGAKVKQLVDGGVDLRTPIEYRPGVASNFYGFSTYPLTAVDAETQGIWYWRGIVVPIGVALTELLLTNGEKTAVQKLVESKIGNGMRTMRQRITLEMLQGNRGPGPGFVLGAGTQIDGLEYALNYINNANDGYAGWDKSTDLQVRHEVHDVGVSFTMTGGVVTTEPLCEALDDHMMTVTHGMGVEGQVTLLVASRMAIRYLVQRARFGGLVQMVVNQNLVDLGIKCAEYGGVPVIWEPALDTNLAGEFGVETDACIYGLNTRYMELAVHSQADMKRSELEKIQGQEAFTSRMIWLGNLRIKNPRHFFTLFNIVAPTIVP